MNIALMRLLVPRHKCYQPGGLPHVNENMTSQTQHRG